ncbi:dTDP-4-amino-4,6-dideoxygalactose transaminase [Plantibacter sp. VKM Ac-2885]|uniref:dTDP-4-amino-4,6-dideoxygalactose transaminase n=1 Tax=Plantibacter sp. VKM Ac-2885 TaxID=2783828 RepID=UPI00351BEF8B
MHDEILFSRPLRTPNELSNLAAVLESGHSHGDGAFTARATARLQQITGSARALLTTSCTHALELAMLLLDLGPGDEVILPSFTFPSAATAVVSRGATPVFVDIDISSGNIDPAAVGEAITARTRAVIVMHYGGVPADLEGVFQFTAMRGIAVIEDNAHGLGGIDAQGRRLGTVGAFGVQSFHDTKNVQCGEGGAILLNDDALFTRAEIIREKGTDRGRFLRGDVDKYTWQDVGSSYVPSELNAAVLDSQLASFYQIQVERFRIWNTYADALRDWAGDLGIRSMADKTWLLHSAHLFYLLMPDRAGQSDLISHLGAHGIRATFHYVPLHSSPAGRRFGRTSGRQDRSHSFSERLVRLPLWPGLTDAQVSRVLEAVLSYRPRR